MTLEYNRSNSFFTDLSCSLIIIKLLSPDSIPNSSQTVLKLLEELERLHVWEIGPPVERNFRKDH